MHFLKIYLVEIRKVNYSSKIMKKETKENRSKIQKIKIQKLKVKSKDYFSIEYQEI